MSHRKLVPDSRVPETKSTTIDTPRIFQHEICEIANECGEYDGNHRMSCVETATSGGPEGSRHDFLQKCQYEYKKHDSGKHTNEMFVQSSVLSVKSIDGIARSWLTT